MKHNLSTIRTEVMCLHWAYVSAGHLRASGSTSAEPYVFLWSCLAKASYVCFPWASSLLLTSHPGSLFRFVVQVRVHAPAPTQPHGHVLVCRCTDAGKSAPGAPHGDLDLFWFTPQLSGQAEGPAGSQRRSQRASTSQRWDSRLAWRGVFDVALSWAMLPRCYAFN